MRQARIARFDIKRRGPLRAVWRGGRVAEGARLESVFTGNRNVGSNPTPSATTSDIDLTPILLLAET